MNTTLITRSRVANSRRVPRRSSMISVDRGMFRLDGQPFFFYAGEIHYFRLPPQAWRLHLRRAKQAGLNTISTYIPWSWHEAEEGRWDFTGETHPQRNLLRFLELIQEERLYASVRIGPVTNAELVGEGLPQWLSQRYPEVFLSPGETPHGYLPHVTLLSYLHPTFRRLVTRWYDRLLPLVSDRQLGEGGPIILVQLCNEIGMIHWLHKASNGQDQTTGLFQRFLAARYGTMEALNEAYQGHFQRFEEIQQPEGEVTTLETLPPHVDWALFYRRYYAVYFAFLAGLARQRGIVVPLSANAPQFYDYDMRGRGVYSPMTTSLYRDFSVLAPRTVFGGAYQIRRLDFDNFHDLIVTTEMTKLLATVRASQAPSQPVQAVTGDGIPEALWGRKTAETQPTPETPTICAEMQTGIMRDRPRLYPQDVELNLKTAIGHGLNGVNCYMFSGGRNPSGSGIFGTYHEWQAPVTARGTLRPHYQPLAALGRWLRWAAPWLAQTHKVSDLSLGFYLPYYGTEYCHGPWTEGLERRRNSLFFDGLARLLSLAGFNYICVDLQRSTLATLSAIPSLWVFALEFMDRETQETLAAYVAQGGHLVLTPRLPTMDLRGRPITVLAERLGIQPDGEAPGSLAPVHGQEYWFEGPFQRFKILRGSQPTTAGKPVLQLSDGTPWGVLKRSGKGEVLVVGAGVPHLFDYHVQLVAEWARLLGLTPHLQVSPSHVQGVMRRGEGFGFLFLCNYDDYPQEVRVRGTLPGTGQRLAFPAQGRLWLDARHGVILPLRIPLGEGRFLSWSTAEVVQLRIGRVVTLSVTTPVGHPLEVGVEWPRAPQITLDGYRLPSQRRGRTYVVRSRATHATHRLVIH